MNNNYLHAPRTPYRRVALAVGLALLSMQAAAASKTYTLDGDFDLGTLVNVNHDNPNNHQLQLNTTTSTFPVMWIANGGEDTLSKFDTEHNKEVARYRTWFGPSGQAGHVSHLGNPWAGPAPSRTAVDSSGNAYVANRWFSSSQPAWVMKILTEGGIDRNGNGVIDTSQDLNNTGLIGDAAGEILPMADANGNGAINPSEITDERIAWAVPVGPNNGLGRALCIGTDGHLWVGLYNLQQYYKISSVDGSILAGPVSTAPTAGQSNAGAGSPYGCLIDGNGTLWGATLTGILTKITNTQSNTGPWTVASFNSGQSNYGVALGNGMVYLGVPYNSSRYQQFNPGTNAFSFPGQGAAFASTGISVDGDGNIVTGNYNGGGVTKFGPAGNVIWTAGTQANTDTRGVIPDQDGNIWQVSRTGNLLMKYRGTDGAFLGTFPIGNQPYTYSDVNGFANFSVTNPSGSWNAVYDSGAAGTQWGTVNWNDLVPAGTSLIVEVRVAENAGDLPLAAYMPVSKNAAFSATGRYIQVQARLASTQEGVTPVLYDLTVNSVAQAKCDVDQDGDIDRADLTLISGSRGQTPTANDPRDANSDGRINAADAKVCIPKCTRANCATQ